MTYGYADEHGTLIGYFDAPDDDGASSLARDWLATRPACTCVEVWRDERDEDGELPESFTVRP